MWGVSGGRRLGVFYHHLPAPVGGIPGGKPETVPISGAEDFQVDLRVAVGTHPALYIFLRVQEHPQFRFARFKKVRGELHGEVLRKIHPTEDVRVVRERAEPAPVLKLRHLVATLQDLPAFHLAANRRARRSS